MAETIEKLSSGTIAGGAVISALNAELQRAFDNIVDPNTPPDKARTVVLTIKIEPNKDRDEATVSFVTTSKLPPPTAIEVEVSVVADGVKARVREGATISCPLGLE